MIIYLYLIIN